MATSNQEDSGNEKFTLFYGQEMPFSQFHKAEFTINDFKYSCAEQYMMHQKAVTFKDGSSAELILKATEPRQMKAMGRKVVNFDIEIWKKKCQQVVREGNIAKNPHLLKQLFATKGTTLVEASPRDCVWGIGLGKNNPNAQNRAKWRGKNQLGRILTEVRDELMKNCVVDDEEEEKEEHVAVKEESSKSREAKSTVEKYVFFHDQESPFSHFHPSEFMVDDVRYSSAEQYMMHQKALEFKDKTTAEKVLLEDQPRCIKQIVGTISKNNKDKWIRKCKDVALKANMAKFGQNKKLRNALFLTKGVEFAQDNSDQLFGIGFGAKNPKANDPSKWTGKNILGQVLNQVRENLMETHLDEVKRLQEEANDD